MLRSLEVLGKILVAAATAPDVLECSFVVVSVAEQRRPELRSLLQWSFLRCFRSVLHRLQMGICFFPTLLLSVSLQCFAFGKGNLGCALRFRNSRVGYGCDAFIRGSRLGVSFLPGKLLRSLGLGLHPVGIRLGIVLGGFASCLSYIGLNIIRRFGLVTGEKPYRHCGEQRNVAMKVPREPSTRSPSLGISP